MSARPLGANRVVFSLVSGLLCIGLTLFSIYLLSASATQPETPNNRYLVLLVVASLSMFALTGIVSWQIYALLRRLNRQDSSGTRLSLSFATSLIGASLIPIGIIAFFAWQFLSYDLGKTFNSRVNTALEDALELTRASANMRAGQALVQTRFISDLISSQSYGELVNNIEAMRRQAGAVELAVFDRYGIVVAFAHRDTDVLAVEALDYDTLLRIDEQQEFSEFSENQHEYTISVFADIDKLGSEPYYLRASYAMPDSYNLLADSVRVNYEEHRFYEYLQPHITTTLLVVLALILTLTILITLWLGVLFGEHMTRPLRKLILATRKVADGNFSSRISGMPKNDLGTLGEHFNTMTQALSDAEENAGAAQRALTEQKAYLETIMDNLTAGVITFNHRQELQTFNVSASRILNTPLATRLNQPLPDSDDAQDGYEELMLALRDPLTAHLANWQQEVTLSRFGQRKVLMCHGSHLIEAGKRVRGGQVIVFDDITEFLHNQRNAAWEEVAKRLAHEIKNPLTPIRLQSERLQRKLSDKLDQDTDRELLTKATTTIIDQVETMHTLVSEFGLFARPLAMRTIPVDINTLIRKAGELYIDQHFQYALDEGLPQVAADPVQMHQVFLNLIKNAQEASDDPAKLDMLWTSRQDGDLILLTLEDNGPGFADLSKDPFEPYITTKIKGSGLGLAIVKKIITEHGGSISVGRSDTLGGACIRFTLPIYRSKEAKETQNTK